MDLAAQNGLGVVLSAIAEIQPCWIHREVPGSELVTNLGQKVVSSNRNECHFGLTPGGCFDHPGVWERMAGLFTQVATRYAPAPNLRGWDCWKGWTPNIVVEPADGSDAVFFIKHGTSGGRRMVFVFFPDGCERRLGLKRLDDGQEMVVGAAEGDQHVGVDEALDRRGASDRQALHVAIAVILGEGVDALAAFRGDR